MIILGIDPGSRKAGFGLIEKIGNKINYIDSRTIKYDTKKSALDRIPQIHETTMEIVKKYKADVVSIESLIYVKSPTALIKLGQTRGVMLSALFQCGYAGKIFEYSPNLVKSATTGHGHSDKLAGQKYLDMILGPRNYSTDDESDALLIAMCHAFADNVAVPKKAKGKRSLADSVAHKI